MALRRRTVLVLVSLTVVVLLVIWVVRSAWRGGEPERGSLGEPTAQDRLTQVFHVPGRFTGVACGELEGDGRQTIVVAGPEEYWRYAEVVVCDLTGRELKRFRISTDEQKVLLAQLDDDGQKEFVTFGVWKDAVTAYDTDGGRLWSYSIGSGVDDVAIADVDGDGKDEVVIGYNGSPGIHLLSADGALRWKNARLGNVWHVAAADLGADGDIEILAPDLFGHSVQLFDARGKALRALSIPLVPKFVGVAEVALDQKGPEVIVSGYTLPAQRAVLLVLSSTGKKLWEASVGFGVGEAAEDVAVVAGKVAVVKRAGVLFLFSDQGKLLAQVKGLGDLGGVEAVTDASGKAVFILACEKGLFGYTLTEE